MTASDNDTRARNEKRRLPDQGQTPENCIIARITFIHGDGGRPNGAWQRRACGWPLRVSWQQPCA